VVELECLPYAIGQADEGICLLLRLGPYRVLLDCGLRDITPLQAAAASSSSRIPLPADLVLCSHAHPDHARGLLALHQAFPQLPIYASEVTAHLLPLNWLTPARERQAPLPLKHFCQALPWRSPVEFGDGLTAELFPVGHLPGAAAFLLAYTPPLEPGAGDGAQQTYTVFYTGDFFLSNSRLVEGLPLEDLRGLTPDVLIIEGSFGTGRYPHRRQQENQFAERLSQALKQGVSVILPVPVLGLGQELLMLLRSHHYFTGQDLDIWVDETIATGCDAYLDILPHLPSNVRNFAQHQPLFWDERVKPRVRRLDPSKPLWEQAAAVSPCIVLTDKHVNLDQFYQPDGPTWLLLLPRQTSSIAQAGTPAPEFLNPVLAKFETEIAEGRILIDSYLLAEHSDGPGTAQLIHNLRPQHVVFVHGTPGDLTDLTGLEELSNRYHLHCPTPGTPLELPVGAVLISASPSSSTPIYEGEIAELAVTGAADAADNSLISITLPGELTTDPRWRALADTGLVTAIWQGNELLIRGISARELLMERGQSDNSGDCCATCEFCRNQRCWNQASALHGFKVSLEGYCPVYAPAGITSTATDAAEPATTRPSLPPTPRPAHDLEGSS
jgi:Cft2 family RNA processing exonuclease